MIHTIKIDGSYIPDGWVPVGFGRPRTGEHYIDKYDTVARWGSMADSCSMYLKVEREKWKPKNGDVVLTFDAATGVYNLTFRAGAQEHVSLKEKGFLFETLKEAQHAYNETLTLMKKLKEEK